MQANSSTIDLDKAYQEYEHLPQQFKSLIMATVSEEGIPDASYAVYVQSQSDYYVYISELAIHTENIAKTGHVSVLFIENEEHAQHLFARQRVTQQCEACEIGFESDLYQQIMQIFSEKFGKFMRLLEDKRDFHLFRIRPIKGAYVAGFGRAFTTEGKKLNKLQHINDSGHKASAHPARQ